MSLAAIGENDIMQRILVTGANGYIGSSLGEVLSDLGFVAYGSTRSNLNNESGYERLIAVGNIDSKTDWHYALADVECVVHLAARAHIMNDQSSDANSMYMDVNCNGTLHLAKQAVKHGIKRFVYISSIGVLGDMSKDSPLTTDSKYSPANAYAYSKMKAEKGLVSIMKDSNMEVVIVRPPLVYGANAPGNFLRLLKLVKIGIPLPFGSLYSKKSMISIDNLLDFIVKCIVSPYASNQKFVISDGSNWSTAELVKLIVKYMNRNIYLIPIPIFLLRSMGSIIGEAKAIDKLSSPLVIDSSYSMEKLAWTPVQLPERGLKKAVEGFVRNISHEATD